MTKDLHAVKVEILTVFPLQNRPGGGKLLIIIYKIKNDREILVRSDNALLE
jgi:hypothetical protein